MTYSVGNVIQASDYNTFATSLGNIWGTGSGDQGWGQTAISSVSANGVVAATNWSTLVANLATAGSQTNSTITSRTAPVTGNVISILANVATDISTVTTNRGNTATTATVSTTWTGNIAKTSATSNGTQGAWTITFTHVVTFPSADQARYFWNAGGLIRLDMSKTSTGTDIDADWNTFVGKVGSLYLSGRVNGATQLIAGTGFTGFTQIGGTITPSPFASTTGWYTLVANAAPTTMATITNTVSPYTGETITVTAAKNAASTAVTFVTTWNQPAVATAGTTTNISGGTDTASPYVSSFGTAPAVLCRTYSPATTYLANTWGTATVAATVA